MSDGSAPASRARPRMEAAVLLAVLGPAIAFAVSSVDPLLLTVNLSQVSRALHVPPNLVGSLGSAATLVLAAAVLAVGNLGDRFGPKRLLLYGLVLNIVAELLAAVSPNYTFLLVMRLLDGIALTALLGLSLALMTASVSRGIRPVAVGVMMATNAVLYCLAPVVGGFLVGTLGWRWLFVIPPVLSLVALVLTRRYVNEPSRGPAGKIDVLGVVLFGVSLLGLVYGMGQLPDGLTRPQAWVPLTVCVLALGAFVRHVRRTREPALDLALFARPPFVVAVLTALTLNFLVAGYGLVLGQLGSIVLALPAQEIGLLYLPGILLLAGISVLAGQLVARYTARPVLIPALLVLVAFALVLAFTVSPVMALWLLVVVTWLGNVGAYLAATPASDTILSHALPGKEGAVAAVYPAFGMTGYALGAPVYILLLNLFFHRQWLKDAQARGLSVEQAQNSVDAVRSSLASSPGVNASDPGLIQHSSGLALAQDYTNAVRLTMLVITLVPLGLLLLAYFRMPRRPHPGARHRASAHGGYSRRRR